MDDIICYGHKGGIKGVKQGPGLVAPTWVNKVVYAGGIRYGRHFRFELRYKKANRAVCSGVTLPDNPAVRGILRLLKKSWSQVLELAAIDDYQTLFLLAILEGANQEG